MFVSLSVGVLKYCYYKLVPNLIPAFAANWVLFPNPGQDVNQKFTNYVNLNLFGLVLLRLIFTYWS